MWSNERFVQYGPGLSCRGASAITLLTINSRDMLAISSYYDSVNNNYQSKSIVFEWRSQSFQAIQEITTHGARGIEHFKISNDHFLVFVNSRSSPALYKWDGTRFISHQNLPVSNARAVKEFTMNGEGWYGVN